MPRRRYQHPSEQFGDPQTHNSIVLPPDVSPDEAAEELYGRIGDRFSVTWEPWASAEPIIDTDTLPTGVSEATVAAALTAMKNDGWLQRSPQAKD